MRGNAGGSGSGKSRFHLEGWQSSLLNALCEAYPDLPCAERARIVLAVAAAGSRAAVAREVGISARTIGKWCAGFKRDGLAGLDGRLALPRLSESLDDQRQVLQALRAEARQGRSSASTRDLARRTGWSQSKASRLRRALAHEAPTTAGALLAGNLFADFGSFKVSGLYFDQSLAALAIESLPGPRTRPVRTDRLDLDRGSFATLYRAARLYEDGAGPAGFRRWCEQQAKLSLPENAVRTVLVSTGRTQVDEELTAILDRYLPESWTMLPSTGGWLLVLSSWLGHQRQAHPQLWEALLDRVLITLRSGRIPTRFAWDEGTEGFAKERATG